MLLIFFEVKSIGQTTFSNEDNVLGIAIADNGDVYLSHDNLNGTLVSVYTSGGEYRYSYPIGNGFMDIDSYGSLFKCESGIIILITKNGRLITIDPDEELARDRLNLKDITFKNNKIYDVQTKTTSTFGGTILSAHSSFGDFTVIEKYDELIIYGTALSQAQAFPFVYQLSLSLDTYNSKEAKIIISSNADGFSQSRQSVRQTRGIAYNGEYFLTTLPVALGKTPIQPTDIPFYFDESFDPYDPPIITGPEALYDYAYDMYSQGMDVDEDGHFHIVTNKVGSAALGKGGFSTYIAIRNNLHIIEAWDDVGGTIQLFDIAIDEKNNRGFFGEVTRLSYFTLPVIPIFNDIPVLDEPENITENSFDISWNEVEYATAYFVDVATTADFSIRLDQYKKKKVTHNKLTVNDLLPGQDYFIRVQAYDDWTTTDWSEIKKITTSGNNNIPINGEGYLISFKPGGIVNSMDYIQVKNQSTGKTVTLSEDQSLQLIIPELTKINNLNSGCALKIFPNPVKEAGQIQFYTSDPEYVNVAIYDVTGKCLLNDYRTLQKGRHTYSISGLSKGAYIARITEGENQYTAHLISINQVNNKIDLIYLGTKNDAMHSSARLKKVSSNVFMEYNKGDVLIIKATSDQYVTIKTITVDKDGVVEMEFVACIDEDKNYYPSVKIGDQWWMGANLATTKYNNGKSIKNITDPYEWTKSDDPVPAYCWYDNDENNKGDYGALYNGFAVDSRKLCPVGWHIPTDDEWDRLAQYVSDTKGPFTKKESGSWQEVGLYLKATSEWTDEGNGLNEFGFNAKAGGYRDYLDGDYSLDKTAGYWWSSDIGELHDELWTRELRSFRNDFDKSSEYKGMGYSIRCVKD